MNENTRRIVSLLILIVMVGSLALSLFGQGAARHDAAVESSHRLASQEAIANLIGSPKNVPVIVFVASWCPHCKALEAELTRLHVDYYRADIEADWRAGKYFERFSAASGGGIPLTLVGDSLIPGENAEAIVREIERQSKNRGNLT